jgi:pilus assembly protein CpaC
MFSTRRRTGWILGLAVGAALMTAGTEAVAQPEPEREEFSLTMTVGEQISLPARGVTGWSVADRNIVNGKLEEATIKIVLVALAPGTTTVLLIFGKENREALYTVTVNPRERVGAIPERSNIRLDFYYVELSETASHQVGVGWPGTIGGTAQFELNADLQANEVTSATASVAAEVLPRLDLAQDSGWARVVRQQTLIMANGGTGKFSSGGEVNIRLEGALTVGIQQIEFGSQIQVQPRYDPDSGRIEINFNADVSTLTGTEFDNLPGRNVTRLTTIVNVELGHAVVVAGLLGKNESRSTSGLPLLSQIPVLGYLFGSRGAAREHSENVLFIVPTLVDSVTQDRRDRVAEALATYEGYDGDLGESPLYVPGATPAPTKPKGRKAPRRKAPR